MNMIHFSGPTDISRSFIPENRRYLKNRGETFVLHGGSRISGSQQTVVSQIYGTWKYMPTMEHDITLLLSIGDRHKNRAIGCPIDVIF